jgi:hypothetical protein
VVDEPDPAAPGEPEFAYLGVVDPVDSPTRIIGVIRSRSVDGHPQHDIFTRSSGWEATTLPWEHRLGRTEVDLVDITPAAAHAFVERVAAGEQG